MDDIDNPYYLEGTEDILNDFSKRDKETILKVAVGVSYAVLRVVGKNIFKRTKAKLDCTLIEGAKGVTTALQFYFDNLPKGFKRPDNHYEIVNEDGVVLRFNRKPVPKFISKAGYYKCTSFFINKVNGKRSVYSSFHRLVAMTFIPNPDNLDTVNHKDGVKLNNKASNLEWMSLEDNASHAWETGLKISMKGENHGMSKLKQKDVNLIRELYTYAKEDFLIKMCIDFKTTADVINDILKGNNEITLERYRTDRHVRLSKGTYELRKNEWCCEKHQINKFIRGEWKRTNKEFKIKYGKKYNIRFDSIGDILAKRTWNN